jgi:hypothetical protein
MGGSSILSSERWRSRGVSRGLDGGESGVEFANSFVPIFAAQPIGLGITAFDNARESIYAAQPRGLGIRAFDNARESAISVPPLGRVNARPGSIPPLSPAAHLARPRHENIVVRRGSAPPVIAPEVPGYNNALAYPEDGTMLRDGFQKTVQTTPGEHVHRGALYGDGSDSWEAGDLPLRKSIGTQ